MSQRTSGVAGLKVIEIQGSVAGAYTSRLLADQGARVRVHAHESSSLSVGDARGLEGYLRVGLDVVPFDDRRVADDLIDADVLIESNASGSVAPPARVVPDRLIQVSVSPFGSTGPRSSWRSSDIVDQAVAGHLFLTGDPDREPLQGPEFQVMLAAGSHAAIGTLAAVRARRSTGRGQRVDVSHHEVMTALHQFTLLRYTHNGDVLGRLGNRYAGPGRPIGAYRCGDGMISLVVPRDDQLDRLLGVAGLDRLIDEPGIESTYDLMHHPTLLDEHLIPWLASQDREETIELLQALRVPAGPVSTLADVLADDHLEERGYWRNAEVDGHSLRVPGPPFTISTRPAADGPSRTVQRPRHDSADAADLSDGPLTGVRILDLTRVWAGPLATRILADLGADVIMIEAPWARGPAHVDRSSVLATHYYPDDEPGPRHWNRIGFANKYGVNKGSIALDLTTPDGLETFEALVAVSDVVIENYSPRVMPQLGLGEERLHALNPSLVYVTMPGYGRTGPSVDRVAYGPIIDSHAGLSVLQGYRDDVARKGGIAWPDPVAGMHAAFATQAALLAVADDGRGRTVEAAQFESTVVMIGHALAQRQLDGAEPALTGNRHRFHAPQGVYPCRGQDRWLAITIIDDADWITLCAEASLPLDWRAFDRGRRREEHEVIDAALGSWTSHHDVRALATRLQEIGITAGEVADAPMVQHDEQHLGNGFFVELEHPEAGTHAWPKLAIRLSDTPATYRRPAPCLNQDADALLAGLIGLSPERIGALRAVGAIADEPPSVDAN